MSPRPIPRRIVALWFVALLACLFLVYSYQGESLRPLPVHALHVLAGVRNSLLLWSPLAGFGIAGLLIAARRGDPLGTRALAVLAGYLWIYGGWWAYDMGFSFGQRGFVDASLLLMLGVAVLLDAVAGGRAKQALGVAMGLAVSWNLWMVFAVRAEVQHPGEPFAGPRLFREAGAIAAQPFSDAKRFTAIFGRRFPVMTPRGSVPAEPGSEAVRD